MTVNNIEKPLEKLDSKNEVALAERRGQPFTWSSFDNATHGDIVYAGHCGAGKNLLIQEETTSILGSGGRVFILDMGRNFQKFAQLLQGEIIQITPKEPLSLNPFNNLVKGSGSKEDYRSNVGMVRHVLANMISPSEILDEIKTSFLEMALNAAIADNGTNTEVSDVGAWLLTHADQHVRDMGTRLYNFAKEGIYGKFFTGPSTVTYSNPLTIATFENIIQNKGLYAVVLQILIVNILTIMYKSDRRTTFAIIIDEEAREFLADKAGGEKFIEIAAQQAHKYGGFLIVV